MIFELQPLKFNQFILESNCLKNFPQGVLRYGGKKKKLILITEVLLHTITRVAKSQEKIKSKANALV